MRDSTENMDEINIKILEVLQEDAKTSYKQLSQIVNLSVSAVVERVKRMEDLGIIQGYRAIVDPRKVGYSMSAILNFSTVYGNPDQILGAIFNKIPEIISCWSVTGTADYLLEVNLPSLEFLEELLTLLSKHGKITTSLVLPSSKKKAYIYPPRKTLEEPRGDKI